MKLKDICCGCLSSERKLSPINYINDSAKNLFFLLSHKSENDQAMSDISSTDFSICWECNALLRRLCTFRRQVIIAQVQLTELLDDKQDVKENKECLSKLSYSFKRAIDKEIVYSERHREENTDYDPGIDSDIDIKTDDLEPIIDIKTETEKPEDIDIEENPFSDLNTDAIKEENKHSENEDNEMKITDTNIGDNLNIEATIDNIEESGPKRRVLRRKAKDTAKRKNSLKKETSKVAKDQNDSEEENKNLSEQIQTVCPEPKVRRPRKIQNKGKEDSSYPCADCGQVFTTYTRRYEHIMKHHKEGYQCSTCGKRFHIKKSFLRHERVHIAKTLPREKCAICEVMVRCDLVQEHAARHASKDAAQYECVPCGKRFANRNSYKKHMTEAKAHLTQVDKKFECETCHKSFPTLLLYNCHMRYTKRHAAHAAVYRYKCSMCDKSYRNPAALRDHANYVHMGKTQHKCGLCDKALASPQCVARHKKLFHGGHKYPKNKLCDTCGKAFSSKKDLREHASVHTGARPLKCDACGDTFRQSGALHTHKRRVHRAPLRPPVALASGPDATLERLLRRAELSDADLLISRAARTH